MRKLLLVLTTCFLSAISVHSQINKGSVLLGGGINFGTWKDKDSLMDRTSNSITLFPAIGLAFKTNTIAGVQLTYSHSRVNPTFPGNPVYTSNAYGGELFLRKYKPLGKGFYLFGQAGLAYRESRHISTLPTFKDKQVSKSITAELHPGIAFAVSKRFHLEIGLNDLVNMRYASDKYYTKDVLIIERNGVDLNVGVSSVSQLLIGFRFFITK